MLATTPRLSPAERTARDCLRYARGKTSAERLAFARSNIELAIALAGRAATPRVRDERLAQYRAALDALDAMITTKES